jgi:hypothetical protein
MPGSESVGCAGRLRPAHQVQKANTAINVASMMTQVRTTFVLGADVLPDFMA